MVDILVRLSVFDPNFKKTKFNISNNLNISVCLCVVELKKKFILML